MFYRATLGSVLRAKRGGCYSERREESIASEASNLTIARSEQGIKSEVTLCIVIKNSYKYNNIILCHVFCNTAAQVSQS